MLPLVAIGTQRSPDIQYTKENFQYVFKVEQLLNAANA